MEFEGESPAPRPPAPSEPSGMQNITVTPENVVALATVFRGCADRLLTELTASKQVILLFPEWMDDPVSDWVEQRFKEYLLDGETALFKVLQDVYGQYLAVTKALIAIGEQYELTEDLVAAGFVDVGTSE